MRTVVLVRKETSDAGTFGVFTLDDGTTFASGELPERHNDPKISCIPPRSYTARWMWSPKHHRYCYHLVDVPGRTAIEIHAANWMGDARLLNPATKTVYLCELLGCIALGDSLGELAGQRALLSSADAIRRFEKALGACDPQKCTGSEQTFQLVIYDVPPEEAATERKVA